MLLSDAAISSSGWQRARRHRTADSAMNSRRFMRSADWRTRVAMAAHRADGHHAMLDFRLKGRHDFSLAALADQCRASTPMEIRPMIDEAEKRGHVERCAQVARRGASRDRSRLRAGGVLSYRSMDAVLQKLGRPLSLSCGRRHS
jgi:hypothetical protein